MALVRLTAFAAMTMLLIGEQAQAQVRLGAVGPMTGPSAIFGVQIKNGVSQAVKDLNAKGGILGRKIALTIGDDASDPKQGVSVANDFVREGIKFVVGDFDSSVSIPASDVYADNGVLQITPASTLPAFTERGLWNVFRTCGRDDQQSEAAASYIATHFRGENLAIVEDKSSYGESLADEVKTDLAASGIKPVLFERVNVGQTDFSSVVARLKAVKASLVYWGGTQTEGGLLIRQMREHGLSAAMMGADALATKDFATIAGPSAAGVLMTFGPDPARDAQAASVMKEFAAENIDPGVYALYSYAAVQVIHQAADAAKSLDPKRVAALMRTGVSFRTVLGNLSFDQNGDRKQADYLVYVWKKMADGGLSFAQL